VVHKWFYRRGLGTSDGSVAAAVAFYRSIGRHPITMKRQLPGHVANRLTSAIFREAVWIEFGRTVVSEIEAPNLLENLV
jgi:carnitine 3-dehydrogenase